MGKTMGKEEWSWANYKLTSIGGRDYMPTTVADVPRRETFGGFQIFSFEGIAFYRIFSLIYEVEFFYRHLDFSDSYYKDQGHFWGDLNNPSAWRR